MSQVTQHPATTNKPVRDKDGQEKNNDLSKTATNSTAQKVSNNADKLNRSKKPALLMIGLCIALASCYWMYQRYIHVYTDDARIAADMIDISSKSSGLLTDLKVSTGENVSTGDSIALIDSREVQLKIQELQSNLAAIDADYNTQLAMIKMVEKLTTSALDSAKSQKTVSEATLLSAGSELEFRTNEWRRAQLLREKKMLSQQNWESAQALYRQANQNRQAAVGSVATTQAKLVEAQAGQSQLNILEGDLIKLQHQRSALEMKLKQQQIQVQDFNITVPKSGIVDKIFVDTGEFIQPGRRILLMHDPNKVWVSANIKETQIRHIQIGQYVEVTVDAYPDKLFQGEVIRIGDSATSLYSLLPSTNPSGNFTKVTQRLPIKIAVKQEDNLLKPGMMVEVAINVR